MNRVLQVLIVDDIPSVAALHSAFVAAHPHCELAGVAVTGGEAISATRKLAPDLILLDVHLPGMSGLDALREIRADRTIPQPEIIAVTAARDIDTVRDARLMGVRHYLVKPFAIDDLHRRIDDVLRDRFREPHTPLNQESVDAVMRPVQRQTLPKGLLAETLALVIAALEARSDASAAEIADVTGLSRVSCRRYLEHLAETGVAARSLDYATAGRPSSRYRLLRRSQ